MEHVRVVCISDTHNHAPGEGYTLPSGDILIHAGDLTNQGTHTELSKAMSWLSKADFPVKIIVAGNHDISLDLAYSLRHETGWKVLPEDLEACRKLVGDSPDFIYLEHSAITIDLPEKDVSIRIFGSPYSPDRGKQNWAFQYDGNSAAALWDAVPENTDILITHTPPAGICDQSKHWQEGGCSDLSTALSRIRPSLHVCGHCHEGRGAALVHWSENPQPNQDPSNVVSPWEDPGLNNKKLSKFNLTDLEPGRETAVVNASIMGTSHRRGSKTFNKPVVVSLNLRKHGTVAAENARGNIGLG